MDRIRGLGLALVVAAIGGCGDKKEGGGAATKPAADAAPTRSLVVTVDAGTVTVIMQGAIVVVEQPVATAAIAPPAATVIVDDAAIRVQPGLTSWAAMAQLDLDVGDPVDDPYLLPGIVIRTLTKVGGTTGELAQEYLDALGGENQWGTIGRGGGFSDEVEVDVTYLLATDASLPPTTPLVVAKRDARASQVVTALARVGGVLAVDVHGSPQAFVLAAPWNDPGWGGAPVPDEEAAWDVWVVPGGMVIDAGSEVTMRRIEAVDGKFDPEIVKSALDAYRASLPAGAEPIVDVLVVDEPQAQTLFDVLSALYTAGARRIGVGNAPWKLPAFGMDGTISRGPIGIGERSGSPLPKVTLKQVKAAGELDGAIVRRYLKRNMPKLRYCYEKQLLVKPAIAGVLRLQFAISDTGLVSTSSASGIDPEVDKCAASVVKAIEFPKPKQGVVQVNTELEMLPTGG